MKKILNFSCICLTATTLLSSCNGTNAKQNIQENNSLTDTLSLEEGYVAMFEDNSLAGWEGDSTYWKMQDGILSGEIRADQQPLKNNTFLIWKGGEVGDFSLKTKFKISENGNSGVNYRSDRFTEVPNALRGYQADIDGKNNYTGQNYEERKRTTLAYRGQRTEILNPEDGTKGEVKNNAWSNLKVIDSVASKEQLQSYLKPNDWNELEIKAEGKKLTHYLNGKVVSEVIDNDPQNRKESGLIGVQVHVGPPMKVEYKDMQIKILK